MPVHTWSKTRTQARLWLGEIEKAAKHYRATTGEPICKQLLSRVLYATADFDTTNEIDKDPTMVKKEHEHFYEHFKNWIIEKYEKLLGQSTVRSFQRQKNNNMQVGAVMP